MAAKIMNYWEFAEMFPLGDASNEESWAHLLEKWRKDGKLLERVHWHYHRSGTGVMSRHYSQIKIIKLIIQEARSDRPRPRISYLYQHNLELFVKILEAAASDAAIASNKETDPAAAA